MRVPLDIITHQCINASSHATLWTIELDGWTVLSASALEIGAVSGGLEEMDFTSDGVSRRPFSEILTSSSHIQLTHGGVWMESTLTRDDHYDLRARWSLNPLNISIPSTLKIIDYIPKFSDFAQLRTIRIDQVIAHPAARTGLIEIDAIAFHGCDVEAGLRFWMLRMLVAVDGGGWQRKSWAAYGLGRLLLKTIIGSRLLKNRKVV